MIEEKPDFVIHCGDLFHQFRPTPGALKLAIDILKKLKEANIPFFIIRGNHDASKAQAQRFGGTVLTLLENLGYLVYIQDETIDVSDLITITGIGEYGKATGIILEEVLRNHPVEPKKFNLLALHGYVQGQVSDSIYDMSGYELASTGYNYIALGHYHKKWEDKEHNIFCPGSTEQTSINDWGDPDEDGFFRKSGFYCVKVTLDKKDNNWKINPKYITFNVRPKGRFSLNFEDNFTIEEIIEKSKKFILKHDHEEAIIKFQFEGSLPKGMISMINLSRLPSNTEQKALHVMITQDFSNQKIRGNNTRVSNDEAIEELLINSYQIEKKSLENWLEITNETVRVLGQKTISSENAEEIKVIYDLISDSSKSLLNKEFRRVKEETLQPNKSNNSNPVKKPIEETLENIKSTKQSELIHFINEGENK